jgi:prevent-host-death family protein
MRELSVREANQNFSRLVAEVEKGETVIITKNGRPSPRCTPARGPPGRPRVARRP